MFCYEIKISFSIFLLVDLTIRLSCSFLTDCLQNNEKRSNNYLNLLQKTFTQIYLHLAHGYH